LNRTCPDCHTVLKEISLIVKTGDGGEGWLAWGERPPPEPPKRKLFSVQGATPTLGNLAAMTCPSCGRVMLYAAPPPAGE
jgi:hypothetical protein